MRAHDHDPDRDRDHDPDPDPTTTTTPTPTPTPTGDRDHDHDHDHDPDPDPTTTTTPTRPRPRPRPRPDRSVPSAAPCAHRTSRAEVVLHEHRSRSRCGDPHLARRRVRLDSLSVPVASAVENRPVSAIHAASSSTSSPRHVRRRCPCSRASSRPRRTPSSGHASPSVTPRPSVTHEGTSGRESLVSRAPTKDRLRAARLTLYYTGTSSNMTRTTWCSTRRAWIADTAGSRPRSRPGTLSEVEPYRRRARCGSPTRDRGPVLVGARPAPRGAMSAACCARHRAVGSRSGSGSWSGRGRGRGGSGGVVVVVVVVVGRVGVGVGSGSGSWSWSGSGSWAWSRSRSGSWS